MATSDEELAIIDTAYGIIFQVTMNSTHYKSIQCQGLIVTIASLQGAVQQLVGLVAKPDQKMLALKFISDKVNNEMAKIQDMSKASDSDDDSHDPENDDEVLYYHD